MFLHELSSGARAVDSHSDSHADGQRRKLADFYGEYGGISYLQRTVTDALKRWGSV